MQYAKKIIIPAIVLIVLIAALILTGMLGDKEDTTATTTVDPAEFLYYAEAEDVAAFSLENENGILTLEKSANGGDSPEWTVASPAHPAYESGLVVSLATSLRTIVTIGNMGEKADNLADYGLDEPTARVTVTEVDGDSTVMLLGNQAGSGSNYYAMVEGGTTVYTITTSAGMAMLRSPLDLLDATLCSVQYENIKTFSMTRASDGTSITLNSSPALAEDGSLIEYHWTFVEPIHWSADTLSMETIVNEVIASFASDFVAMDVEDYSEYGLDDPQYKFEISDANQTYTITIGDSAGSGILYGSSSRLPGVVFTTSASNFTSTDGPITSWMDRFIYLADINTVSRVELTLDGQKLDIGVDVVSEPNIFLIDGEDANIETNSGKSYFKSFYQSIISGMMEGLDPEATPAYEDTITRIRYTHIDGDPVTVAYAPRDAYSLYAFIDGTYTGAYVDIDVLDGTDYGVGNALPEGLRPAYEGLTKAMEHAVDGIYN